MSARGLAEETAPSALVVAQASPIARADLLRAIACAAHALIKGAPFSKGAGLWRPLRQGAAQHARDAWLLFRTLLQEWAAFRRARTRELCLRALAQRDPLVEAQSSVAK
jgi:hypothetical protein